MPMMIGKFSYKVQKKSNFNLFLHFSAQTLIY